MSWKLLSLIYYSQYYNRDIIQAAVNVFLAAGYAVSVGWIKSRPMRGQNPGHVVTLSQSEANIQGDDMADWSPLDPL